MRENSSPSSSSFLHSSSKKTLCLFQRMLRGLGSRCEICEIWHVMNLFHSFLVIQYMLFCCLFRGWLTMCHGCFLLSLLCLYIKRTFRKLNLCWNLTLKLMKSNIVLPTYANQIETWTKMLLITRWCFCLCIYFKPLFDRMVNRVCVCMCGQTWTQTSAAAFGIWVVCSTSYNL